MDFGAFACFVGAGTGAVGEEEEPLDFGAFACFMGAGTGAVGEGGEPLDFGRLRLLLWERALALLARRKNPWILAPSLALWERALALLARGKNPWILAPSLALWIEYWHCWWFDKWRLRGGHGSSAIGSIDFEH